MSLYIWNCHSGYFLPLTLISLWFKCSVECTQLDTKNARPNLQPVTWLGLPNGPSLNIWSVRLRNPNLCLRTSILEGCYLEGCDHGNILGSTSITRATSCKPDGNTLGTEKTKTKLLWAFSFAAWNSYFQNCLSQSLAWAKGWVGDLWCIRLQNQVVKTYFKVWALCYCYKFKYIV